MHVDWPDVTAMLIRTAGAHGGTAEITDQAITLRPAGRGEPITIRAHSADTAIVEAGWVIRTLASCEDDEHQPPRCYAWLRRSSAATQKKSPTPSTTTTPGPASASGSAPTTPAMPPRTRPAAGLAGYQRPSRVEWQLSEPSSRGRHGRAQARRRISSPASTHGRHRPQRRTVPPRASVDGVKNHRLARRGEPDFGGSFVGRHLVGLLHPRPRVPNRAI
jgi:hypothetical protein